MLISDGRLDDFVRCWEQAFGQKLSRDAAQLIAGRLAHMYRQMSRVSLSEPLRARCGIWP
jgi:hypothetical protein